MKRSKGTYASDRINAANDSAWSLTLRQLQTTVSSSIFWMVICMAVVLVAMAGPYYTLEGLSFPERLVYWGVTIPLSTLVMTFLSVFAYRVTEETSLHWAFVAILAGLGGVLPVVGSVYLSEALATGFKPGWFAGVGVIQLAMHVTPALIGVTLLVNALFEFDVIGTERSAPAATRPQTTLLQGKLPAHLGHEIVTMRAQDHYVEVTTPKGSAMILMRLGDAVRDLEPLGGVQVHRSWWVNPAHLIRVETGRNGQELVMTTGSKVPVGRSFRKTVKDVLRGSNA